VLDYLLPEMENKRGSWVVVLAGYQKPMEEQIMAYNEGLPPSRFPLVPHRSMRIFVVLTLWPCLLLCCSALRQTLRQP
jgi:hypothetical protein